MAGHCRYAPGSTLTKACTDESEVIAKLGGSEPGKQDPMAGHCRYAPGSILTKACTDESEVIAKLRGSEPGKA
eukprot:1158815-Pelagomonas_calceolata.AAC.7